MRSSLSWRGASVTGRGADKGVRALRDASRLHIWPDLNGQAFYNGTLYVLEINTIPGRMTETSPLPQAAAALNITFPKLIDTIIAAALRRETDVGNRI